MLNLITVEECKKAVLSSSFSLLLLKHCIEMCVCDKHRLEGHAVNIIVEGTGDFFHAKFVMNQNVLFRIIL